jgi:hypothetical protein
VTAYYGAHCCKWDSSRTSRRAWSHALAKPAAPETLPTTTGWAAAPATAIHAVGRFPIVLAQRVGDRLSLCVARG